MEKIEAAVKLPDPVRAADERATSIAGRSDEIERNRFLPQDIAIMRRDSAFIASASRSPMAVMRPIR